MDRPRHRLPDSLTRHLRAPEDAVWPTPDDPARYQTGPHRPRQPTLVFKGVWLWAIAYNVIGAAILAAVWASLGR